MPRIEYNDKDAEDTYAAGRVSEAAVANRALRTLKNTKPVTVMEDIVGRFSESKGQSNAVRDAIREKATKKYRAYGGYDGYVN